MQSGPARVSRRKRTWGGRKAHARLTDDGAAATARLTVRRKPVRPWPGPVGRDDLDPADEVVLVARIVRLVAGEHAVQGVHVIEEVRADVVAARHVNGVGGAEAILVAGGARLDVDACGFHSLLRFERREVVNGGEPELEQAELPAAGPPKPAPAEGLKAERRWRLDAIGKKDETRPPEPGRQRQRGPRAGPAPAEAGRPVGRRPDAGRTRPPRKREPQPAGVGDCPHAPDGPRGKGPRPRAGRPEDPRPGPSPPDGRVDARRAADVHRRTGRYKRKHPPERPERSRPRRPGPADAHDRRRT